MFAEVSAQKPAADPSDPGCYLMSPVYGRMIFIDWIGSRLDGC